MTYFSSYSLKGTTTKRLNDLSQQFNPNNAPPKPEITLPSLTFASPDYRPPPRPDALWLQPVPSTTTPMMEDDSTDEDDVLPNPSYNNTLSEKQQTTTNGFEWVMTD